MENYYKLTRAELQMLFRAEFGEACLTWSIEQGYKKKEYIKKLRERQRYDFLNENDKKLQKQKWAKENEELLASVERFL